MSWYAQYWDALSYRARSEIHIRLMQVIDIGIHKYIHVYKVYTLCITDVHMYD